jgi:hypothetical protein
VCGISGYTQRGGVFNPSAIRESIDRFFHGDPDQQGRYESAEVSSGAVRLNIIDVGSSAQPFSATTARPFWSSTTKPPFALELANSSDCFALMQLRGRFMTARNVAPTLAFTSWE